MRHASCSGGHQWIIGGSHAGGDVAHIGLGSSEWLPACVIILDARSRLVCCSSSSVGQGSRRDGDCLALLVLYVVLLRVDFFVLAEILRTFEALVTCLRECGCQYRWNIESGAIRRSGGPAKRNSQSRCEASGVCELRAAVSAVHYVLLCEIRSSRLTSHVGCDVVPFGARHVAAVPAAGEAEVVGALSANMQIR